VKHSTKPNIIVLLTDNQDVLLGGLNQMPKLKRLLMERGTTFRNAFVHMPIALLPFTYEHYEWQVHAQLEQWQASEQFVFGWMPR